MADQLYQVAVLRLHSDCHGQGVWGLWMGGKGYSYSDATLIAANLNRSVQGDQVSNIAEARVVPYSAEGVHYH